MVNFIIASHGKLAEGFLSALEILMGKREDIDVVSAYLDEEPLEAKTKSIFSKYAPEDTVIVFTDMYGGSVNRHFAQMALEKDNVHVISGVNLGLMLEVIMQMEEGFDKAQLLEIIDRSRSLLCYVNDKLLEDDDDE